MNNLTEAEIRYVLEVLSNAHTDLMHELHHTVTHKFEEALKQRLAMNEEVTRKLQSDTDREHFRSRPV